MPVERCQSGDRAGYRWSASGPCFIGPDARERAAAVGQAIAVGKRDRKRRDESPEVKRLTPPEAIEDDYRVFMARRVEELHAEILRAVTRLLPRTEIPEEGRRSDGRVEDAASLRRGIEIVASGWKRERQGEAGSLAREVEGVASEVDGFTTRRVAESVQSVAPIDVTQIEAAAGGLTSQHMPWVAENVRLIRNLEDKHITDVTKWVVETVEGGGSTRTLAKRLEQRLGVTQRRAQTIARNEIGNLNAQITKGRQEALGVSQFTWTTVGDDRVRDEHDDINGDVFDWATGHPTEGLPGSPVNCRCIGIAVIP